MLALGLHANHKRIILWMLMSIFFGRVPPESHFILYSSASERHLLRRLGEF